MRQAGSSFGIATQITVKMIDDLPAGVPTDGGDFFPSIRVPRTEMLKLLRNATHETGMLNYIFTNGVDFLIAAASTDFRKNARWLSSAVLGRSLSWSEWAKAYLVHLFEQPVSDHAGADKHYDADTQADAETYAGPDRRVEVPDSK